MSDVFELLKNFRTLDLLAEIARRLNMKYGKLQVIVHAGKPSKYVECDTRFDLEQEEK